MVTDNRQPRGASEINENVELTSLHSSPMEASSARTTSGTAAASDLDISGADRSEQHLPREESSNVSKPTRPFDGNTAISLEQQSLLASSTTSFAKASSTTSKKRRFKTAWLLEILSSLLSVASMAAVVIVLLYEDGKSLSQWRLLLPPNAVISFIATIAKSSLLLVLSEVISQLKWFNFEHRPQPLLDFELYDLASRGPLGSSRLLFQKHRNAFLASLAALLVVTALLIDPFVQLAIRFPSRLTPSAQDEAIFAVTSAYDPTPHVYGPRRGASGLAGGVHQNLQAAILGGLSDTPIERSLTCQTGNCTFEAPTTLSICGTCEPVMDEVKKKCKFWKENIYDEDCTCEYDLSGSFNISARWKDGYIPTHGQSSFYEQTRYNSSTLANFERTWPTSSIYFNTSATLLGFDAVQIPETDSKETFADTDPTAWRCVFQFCAQRFRDLTVSGGSIVDGTPEIDPLFIIGSVDPSDTNVYDTDPAYVNLSTSIYDNSTQFHINQQDWKGIAQYLQELLARGWFDNGTSTPHSYSNGEFVAPNIGKLLASSSNMTRLAENVAASMTESIRTSRNSTVVSGQALIWESYIRVRWGWLALPGALSAITAVLLVLTIRRSNHSDLGPWKSSALPLLFLRLEGWQAQNGGSDPDELSRAAGFMRGRVFQNSDQLCIVNEGGR